MRRLTILIALMLAGCTPTNVRDRQAPDSLDEVDEILPQLNADEQKALAAWWDILSAKVRVDIATDADFDLTVREAVAQGIQIQARAKAAKDCEIKNLTAPMEPGIHWSPPIKC